MTHPNSLTAWNNIQKELSPNRRKVLEAICKLGRCTDSEIAGHLDWSINRVTPRRGELLERGWIIACGTHSYKNAGHTYHATIWKPSTKVDAALINKPKQIELF